MTKGSLSGINVLMCSVIAVLRKLKLGIQKNFFFLKNEVKLSYS